MMLNSSAWFDLQVHVVGSKSLCALVVPWILRIMVSSGVLQARFESDITYQMDPDVKCFKVIRYLIDHPLSVMPCFA